MVIAGFLLRLAPDEDRKEEIPLSECGLTSLEGTKRDRSYFKISITIGFIEFDSSRVSETGDITEAYDTASYFKFGELTLGIS